MIVHPRWPSGAYRGDRSTSQWYQGKSTSKRDHGYRAATVCFVSRFVTDPVEDVITERNSSGVWRPREASERMNPDELVAPGLNDVRHCAVDFPSERLCILRKRINDDVVDEQEIALCVWRGKVRNRSHMRN